jgi:hypothetical protein
MTEFTQAERGLTKGIALMVFIKLVIVTWSGLDYEAIYVWTWLAFAWMLPWVLEIIYEQEGA